MEFLVLSRSYHCSTHSFVWAAIVGVALGVIERTRLLLCISVMVDMQSSHFQTPVSMFATLTQVVAVLEVFPHPRKSQLCLEMIVSTNLTCNTNG